MPRLRIAVAGAGTAGLAAAAFLAEQGHAVTVFERAAELAPVGAGLLMQPTGMAVLKRLGVDQRLAALAAPVRSLRGSTVSGRQVLKVDYPVGVCGMGVHRAALQSVLIDAARRRGVEVMLGVTLAGANAVRLEKIQVQASEGQASRDDFDLFIIADGARSNLRASMMGDLVSRARAYPFGALWFVGPDPDGLGGETLWQAYSGTAGMVGLLPSGSPGPGLPRTLSMFWSVRMRDVQGIRERGLEAWKHSVRSLARTRAIEMLLEQITDNRQLITAGYMDVVMRSVSRGRAVIIGDAAHAMSPQLGQGANLALLDALELAECLAVDRSVEESLHAFARARKSSTRFYQFASRWLTPIFQSDWPAVGPVRDVAFGPMCSVGFVQRQMQESLMGIKTGLWPWKRAEMPG